MGITAHYLQVTIERWIWNTNIIFRKENYHVCVHGLDKRTLFYFFFWFRVIFHTIKNASSEIITRYHYICPRSKHRGVFLFFSFFKHFHGLWLNINIVTCAILEENCTIHSLRTLMALASIIENVLLAVMRCHKRN